MLGEQTHTGSIVRLAAKIHTKERLLYQASCLEHCSRPVCPHLPQCVLTLTGCYSCPFTISHSDGVFSRPLDRGILSHWLHGLSTLRYSQWPSLSWKRVESMDVVWKVGLSIIIQDENCLLALCCC